MRAVLEDGDAKIKAVLTDSQKQTYDQMREHNREHRQGQNAASGNIN